MSVAPERPKVFLSTAITIFIISLTPCLLLILLLPKQNYFLSILPFIGVYWLQRFLPKLLFSDECKQYMLELKKYRKEVKKQSVLNVDGLQSDDTTNKTPNEHK